MYPGDQIAGKKIDLKLKVEGVRNITQRFYLVYTFAAKYWDNAPISVETNELAFSLTRTPAKMEDLPNIGDQQSILFSLDNLASAAHGMAVAMVAIPSCFELNLE